MTYRPYPMYLEELKQVLQIESWREIQLVFYILGIYFGFMLLRWLANTLDKSDKPHNPDDYVITQEQYDSMMLNAAYNARHRTESPSPVKTSDKTKGEAIISPFGGTAKYVWDGTYLSKFSGTKLFKYDCTYVNKFSGTKLYQWDGKVFSPFSGTGKYSVSGNYISVFSGTKLYKFDETGITKFSGTRLYSIRGNIEFPIPLMIMIAEELQGL